MKNKFLTAFLAASIFLSSFTVSAFAADSFPEIPGFNSGPRVVDDADLLTESEEDALEDKIEAIMTEQSFDVVIHTAPTTGGKSVVAYSDDYFDYNGYGYGSNHDGLIFVLVMDTRDYYTSTCGYGITAFTDYGIDYIGGRVVSYLSDGEYYDAFSKYLYYVEDFLVKAKNGSPVDSYGTSKESLASRLVSAIPVALVIALVVAFIVTSVLKSGMKTVKQNPLANNYIKNGSFKLTNSRDIYLYSHTSKVRRETSSSGGGSHSGGGSSTHTSSSGSSHGGGGGKF